MGYLPLTLTHSENHRQFCSNSSCPRQRVWAARQIRLIRDASIHCAAHQAHTNDIYFICACTIISKLGCYFCCLNKFCYRHWGFYWIAYSHKGIFTILFIDVLFCCNGSNEFTIDFLIDVHPQFFPYSVGILLSYQMSDLMLTFIIEIRSNTQ